MVLGAAGMLGHKLMQLWSPRYDTIGTVRGPAAAYDRFGIFDRGRLVGGVDVDDFAGVADVVTRMRPHFLVNCVGVIKQLDAAKDPLVTIGVNALLPHRLARLCRAEGVRLVHVSTDCVFSGDKGAYVESDPTDATDLYGRTKALGEVAGPNCLTLRTSIVGRELSTRNGLIEWFLQTAQEEVRGFDRCTYSGLTTMELARVIELVMEANEEISGIYQVSSDPISKYELLLLVRRAFGLTRRVVPVDTPVIDRSLDSSRFRRAMGYVPRSWPEMIDEMAADTTPYSSWQGDLEHVPGEVR
jgi:dTDP-4-dehydrorhamnose reductase